MSRLPVFVVNTSAASGRTLARWRSLTPKLRRRGLLGPTLAPHGAQETKSAAERAARTGSLVVAVGGDGTVSDVLTGMARVPEPSRLAILPLGTGNDAARSLGISSVSTAIEALEAGETRAIDTISLEAARVETPEARRGLVTAGAGFAADLLRFTPAVAKRWLGGPVAYTLGFFLALRKLGVADLHLVTDGRAFRSRALALVCANAPTAGAGTMRIAPTASMEDGHLDLILVSGLGRVSLSLQFVRLLRGTHLRHPAVTHVRVRDASITDASPVPARLQLDGDLAGCLPARIQVLPASVQVVIGPSYAAPPNA